MGWSSNIINAVRRLEFVKNSLKSRFTARDAAIDLMALAIVCHEHLLLVGPPGTAKTQLISFYSRLMEMQSFSHLLTKFTEPSELFGPLDIKKFHDGEYHIITDRMLPTAQIAFLDEVFQGSSAILNALLNLLSDRVFYNGAVAESTPLISLIGASNVIPQDDALHAFADRFALRIKVDWVQDAHIDELLDHGWELEIERIRQISARARNEPFIEEQATLTPEDIGYLHENLVNVDLSAVRQLYSQLVREIRAEGVELSDRRTVKGLKLIAGAALMRESSVADVRDIWPLKYLWNRSEDDDILRGLIDSHLENAGELITTARDMEQILYDLTELELREKLLTMHSAAIGAHLKELNGIRTELLRDHRDEKTVLAQVEATIARILTMLE